MPLWYHAASLLAEVQFDQNEKGEGKMKRKRKREGKKPARSTRVRCKETNG